MKIYLRDTQESLLSKYRKNELNLKERVKNKFL